MRVLQVSDFFPPVRGGLESHVDDKDPVLSKAPKPDVFVVKLSR